MHSLAYMIMNITKKKLIKEDNMKIQAINIQTPKVQSNINKNNNVNFGWKYFEEEERKLTKIEKLKKFFKDSKVSCEVICKVLSSKEFWKELLFKK